MWHEKQKIEAYNFIAKTDGVYLDMVYDIKKDPKNELHFLLERAYAYKQDGRIHYIDIDGEENQWSYLEGITQKARNDGYIPKSLFERAYEVVEFEDKIYDSEYAKAVHDECGAAYNDITELRGTHRR